MKAAPSKNICCKTVLILVPFGTQTQVFVINTCTVTAESDRKCRQMIRRAHATAPDACIIVTGCYAQTSPDEVQKIPGVHYIFGSRDKMQAAKTALQVLQQQECHDLLSGDSHGGEVNAEQRSVLLMGKIYCRPHRSVRFQMSEIIKWNRCVCWDQTEHVPM